MTNQQWCLKSRPVGMIEASNFEWREVNVPALKEGEVLVRNIYLSLDPTNRGWVNAQASYMKPVGIGEVMRGIALGVVEESRNAGFQKGELLQGLLGWQKYLVTDGAGLSRIPRIPGVPLDAYLGVLGHIGLSAYFGLLEIGEPKAGETLVVTGAAGAVGSLAGQIGKLKGCRVVGIAGSDEKCSWLTRELGFDGAINYKTDDIDKALGELCPEGIDVAFENVGGRIFDAVLGRINNGARVVLCGLISQYNATRPVPGPYNLPNILIRRAKIEGFIVLDYMDRALPALQELAQWMMEGKLNYRVDSIDGLENAPQALTKLFDGSNRGKLMVKVSDEV